jgi:hypothetical protein
MCVPPALLLLLLLLLKVAPCQPCCHAASRGSWCSPSPSCLQVPQRSVNSGHIQWATCNIHVMCKQWGDMRNCTCS